MLVEVSECYLYFLKTDARCGSVGAPTEWDVRICGHSPECSLKLFSFASREPSYCFLEGYRICRKAALVEEFSDDLGVYRPGGHGWQLLLLLL